MAFDFPNAPALDQLYEPAGGPKYRWDGTAWVKVPIVGADGPQGPIGPTGPTGPAGPGVPTGGATGQVLAKTSGADYATAWVPSAPAVGLVDIGDAPPSSPVDRQLYWESDSGAMFIRFDSTWVQVASPGVADCPADGGEYLRVNGLWRLHRQSFDLAGKASQVVTIPTTAKSARITMTTTCSATYQNYMRWSVDGTTFPNGATDYILAGFHYGAGGAAPITQAGVGLSQFSLTLQNTNPTIPDILDIILTTQSLAGSQFNMLTRSSVYNSTASLLATHIFYHQYSNLAAFLSATQLKAFLIFNDGTNWNGSSQMTVEWMY